MPKINDNFKLLTATQASVAEHYKECPVGAVVSDMFSKLKAITEADYSVKGKPAKIPKLMKATKENYNALKNSLEKLDSTLRETYDLTQEDIDAAKSTAKYLKTVIENKDEWLNIIPESSASAGKIAKKWIEKNIGSEPRKDIVEKLQSLKESLETISTKQPTLSSDSEASLN